MMGKQKAVYAAATALLLKGTDDNRPVRIFLRQRLLCLIPSLEKGGLGGFIFSNDDKSP